MSEPREETNSTTLTLRGLPGVGRFLNDLSNLPYKRGQFAGQGDHDLVFVDPAHFQTQIAPVKTIRASQLTVLTAPLSPS